MDLVYENASGDLDTLTFDSTLREVFTSSATVSEHALESGSTVADHVRHAPDRVSLECFVSNSPPFVPSSQMAGIGGSVQRLDLAIGKRRELVEGSRNGQAARYEAKSETQKASVLKFDQAIGRVGRVLSELRRLKDSVTLITGLGLAVEIEDMVIQSIGAPKESTDGDSITFRLELVAVRFASSEIVEVPDPEEPRGRPTVDAGATSTTESSAPESFWHSIMGL